MEKKIKKYIVTSECYIDSHYHVDHSDIKPMMKEKLGIVGGFFEGQPICAWCIARLSVVTDAYGNAQTMGDPEKMMIPGNTVNAIAFFTKEELINRSPLRVVFKDMDLSALKRGLDRVFEVSPVAPIKSNIEQQIWKDRAENLDKSKQGDLRDGDSI